MFFVHRCSLKVRIHTDSGGVHQNITFPDEYGNERIIEFNILGTFSDFSINVVHKG